MNNNITKGKRYIFLRNARDVVTLERNADMIAGALYDFLMIGYYDFLDDGFTFEDVRDALDDLDMIHRAIVFLRDCIGYDWHAKDARVIHDLLLKYRVDLVKYINARW